MRQSENIRQKIIKRKISDFGENIIRSALDKFEFYKFETLKRYFPNLKSIKEFISSPGYLGSVEVEISGHESKVERLTAADKLEVVLSVVKEISEQAMTNISKFIGSTVFRPKLLWEVFKNKKIKIDKDDLSIKKLSEIKIEYSDWFGQEYVDEDGKKAFYYGTSEEQSFINFISVFIERLKEKYSDIALLRNEKFFQIFDFDEGRAFEPDFVMLLKKKNGEVSIYQVFIEPKGEHLVEYEDWKQKFLLEVEKKAQLQRDLIMEMENTQFKLIGLPFYNEKLKKEFEEALEKKVLS